MQTEQYEQDDRDGMAEQQLEEMHRREDEALERHRILLNEFHQEWAQFKAHCARFNKLVAGDWL